MEEIEKGRKIIAALFAILVLVLIMISVTYSLFTYIKIGSTDNTITTGVLKFLYTENINEGTGISISNAFPVSDTVGKGYTSNNEVFDFQVDATNIGGTMLPYEITVRKNNNSTLDEKYVKVYLTDMTEDNDSMLVGPEYFNKLNDTELVNNSNVVEKSIYKKVILPNQENYLRKFRLRMWVADTLEDNSEVVMDDVNGKSFTLTVNVYANANVITNEIANFKSNTEINKIYVSGAEVTQIPNGNINYTFNVGEDITSTGIMVDTLNTNSTVEITRLDSLVYSSDNTLKLSTTKTVNLLEGDNYFNIKVISENKEKIQDYILDIKK